MVKELIKLQSVSTSSKLYVLKDEEEFAHSIFNIISKEREQLTFIDSTCGKKSSHFKTESVD
jgi:hypothetical protein